MQLNDEFNKILPYDYGMKRATGIDNIFRAKDRMKQLTQLADIETYEQCLVKAQIDLKMGPIKSVLHQNLLCEVKALEQEHPLSSLIMSAVKNTHSKQHSTLKPLVRGIYELCKASETLNYRPF